MIQPLYDRVVVQCTDTQETTQTGIIVTGTKKPQEGVVIAVGPGHVMQDGTLRALSVQVGDKVIFPRGSGYALDIESTEVLVFLESELIGIID